MKTIRIKGARTHNLKNIDIIFPRNKLVVITGLSGSGKSSLAFGTIFAEGQRRYVESLSSYARQFLARTEKPDVDQIEGLSPAISIEQKSTSHNPRSTVGTITEIYDYLRLLFARVGTPQCPSHNKALEAKTISQITDEVMASPHGTSIVLMAPVVRNRKGEFVQLIRSMKAQGFLRARINGRIHELDALPQLDLRKNHTIETVVDRLKVKPGVELRLAESLETAANLADGVVSIVPMHGDDPERVFSLRLACPYCGYNLSELEPRLFSFNSPVGACQKCDGLGVMQYFDKKKIVANPSLSLAGGAIAGWDRCSNYNYKRLKSLAKYCDFNLTTPFSSLRKEVRELILYGSDADTVPFEYETGGRMSIQHYHFPGIIPLMERRFEETDSEHLRERLYKYISTQKCSECGGTRLNEAARNVFVDGRSLPDITAMSIDDTLKFFEHLSLPGNKSVIGKKIIDEIKQRLSFLSNVGLEYLTLDRSAETLSGGEAQRIRLASQIGSGLVGVMYILDEPSIGLHQRDNRRLINILTRLRDLDNSVIVVEHDESAIRAADHVIDLGPGAGKHGGNVVAQGTPRQIEKNKQSITGKYLAKTLGIELPRSRVPVNHKKIIHCIGLTGNNLKNINVDIPLGLLVCVTGVSGSGKSTLVNETLYRQLSNYLHGNSMNAAPCKRITGLKQINKVINIDQSPIGRTPRSNPATYTGVLAPIRELFAAVPEARSRGYKPGRFSFNVRGGRCEACRGDGVIRVEMHFLPDVRVRCDVCGGKRYGRETLDIRYKGMNINEVLQMTVEQALEFFNAIPMIRSKLQTMMDVGLAYITLGQSSTTLSGGEAQRIKLSRELSKKADGKTLYILDEPTTGLHFHDVKQLLQVLHYLRDNGNTVVVIEHNMDVIKTADWVIDLGPEGGSRGGEIVAAGTPEELSRNKRSYTGIYLKECMMYKKATAPLQA